MIRKRTHVVCLFVAFSLMTFILSSGTTFGAEGHSAEGKEMVTVLSPLGTPPLIKRSLMAPRLESLDGKTIYLVDVRFNDGDIFLQQMQAWFKENMPKVNVKFVRKSGTYTFNDKKLWQEIKENGHGVVMAIGH